MSCDIIIPVWNQLKHTRECLNSILSHTHYPYRVIIIDNGSEKGTREYLEELRGQVDNVRLIKNEDNLGFVKAVNQGFDASDAPYLCVMNNDTVVTDGWLSEMVDIARSNNKVGLVNPSSNNLGQDKGRYTIDEFAEKLKPHRGQYIEMGSCIGFCMLIKRVVLGKVGRLDEIFRNGNFDDTDYSRKAERQGYLSVRAKGAYVYHHMKASFMKLKEYEESFRKNQEIYNRRWGRPKRLLYIVTKGHGKLFDWMKQDVTTKTRKGDWVWLFFKKSAQALRIKEHSNMKLVYLPQLFFEWNCIFRIIKKKKSFDTIYVDDPGLIERIRRFDKYHNAETMLIGG